MADKLNFTQIVYAEDQRQHCYPFATVYKNEKCTPFFENSVIADIVPQSDAEYTAICSWRLSRKRGDIFIVSGRELKVDTEGYDVAILTPRKHTDIRTKFLHWHKTEAAEIALREFEKFMHFPDEVERSIYENHFIARTDIYKDYVETCLKPAIKFMEEMPIFMSPAGYINRKRGADHEHAMKLLATWGMTDYPIAPFILERLFSIYCNGKGFKIINL